MRIAGALVAFLFLVAACSSADDAADEGDHVARIETALNEIDAIWQELDGRCSHNTVFAYTYLQMTRSGLHVLNEGQLPNPGLLTDLLVTFAARYIDVYESRRAGSDIPEVWRVAFEAGEERTVRGIGDVLLGMNAHIGHDLSLALLDAWPELLDGPPPPEYTLVDEMLDELMGPLIEDLAARYDPTIGVVDLPLGDIDSFGTGQALRAWRSEAWDNAAAIAAAPEGAARDRLIAELDQDATDRAVLISAFMSYLPFDPGVALRENHCDANHGPITDLQ